MSPTNRRGLLLDRALLAFVLAFLALAIAYPTLRLVFRAVREWETSALLQPPGAEAIINTVLLSFASVFTAGVLGTALALILARYSFPGRRLLSALAYLPFALPPLVGVVAFYYLIGRDGFLPVLLERLTGTEGCYPSGPIAILIIHTYSFYVFFYAMVGAALEGFDSSLPEAARTLGASRWRVFTRVTLPLLRPALVGASLLTFMSSGASFSAPLIFGEDFPVLSVRIYQENTNFNEPEALTLTIILACVSLLGVLVFRNRRRLVATAGKGTPRPLRSASGKALGALFAGVVILVLLVPHATILWLSFVDHSEWFDELIPCSFTLENYVEIFRDPRSFAPIRNSLWMSGVAAAATLIVGVPAAYLIGRRRNGQWLVNLLVMIPWALPGTVIAMNLITAFNDPWLPLWTGAWLLPLAYFVRNVPLLTRVATAAIEPFDVSLIEAGRTLGASRWHCFVRIAAPLMAPALIAGAVLVFAMSLGEFVASILLYLPANIPISVMINMQLRGSGIGNAFAYSVFLMLLVGTAFVVARRFSSRLI